MPARGSRRGTPHGWRHYRAPDTQPWEADSRCRPAQGGPRPALQTPSPGMPARGEVKNGGGSGLGCSSRPPSLETPGRAHGGPPQPCRLVCSQADDATSRAQDSPGASMPPPLKLNAQELPSRHRSSRSVSYTARVGPWLGRTSGAPPLGPAARPDERRRRKPRPGPHRRGGPLAAPAMRGARTTRPRATSPCNLSKSSDGLARRAASPLSRSNSCIPGPGIPARPRRTSRLLALLSSMANDPQPWDGGSMRGQACREARGAAHGRQHWEPPTNPAL